MVRNSNKVAVLDYSHSKAWEGIGKSAVEDIEDDELIAKESSRDSPVNRLLYELNSDPSKHAALLKKANVSLEDIQIDSGAVSKNGALDEVLDKVIADKRYDSLLGGEGPDLEGIEGKNNRQKKTEEFWEKERESLRENILEDYEQLKQDIKSGKVKVKGFHPKESVVGRAVSTIRRCLGAIPVVNNNKVGVDFEDSIGSNSTGSLTNSTNSSLSDEVSADYKQKPMPKKPWINLKKNPHKGRF